MMEIGIIGFPQSGKTALFNALTKGSSITTAGANIGVAKVADPRLSRLETIFEPKKTVPVEVKYVDIAVPQTLGKGEGLRGQLLSQLSKVDALVHVVRAFKNDNVLHVQGSVNPGRDIANMNLELVFSDLDILGRRIKRIEESLKGAKPAERDLLLREQGLVSKLKSALESETPIWEQGLSAEETKAIENYQFLTAKPMMIVLNIGEDQISEASALEKELALKYPKFAFAALCAKLEMELAQLTDAEAAEFRSAMGVEEAALPRLIKMSYELMGLVTFFTTASHEVRAWAIPSNTPAPKAAGKIHTDMERGFIRAEVVSYEDLMQCGNLAEARKKGLLRVEGKSCTVKDGDVITFLFNVGKT